MQPPNDQRAFVHKRIFGAAKGFIGGGFTGAIGGFIAGGGRRRGGGQPAPPLTVTQQRKADRFDPNVAAVDPSRPGGCPKGFSRSGNVCRRTGLVGAVQRGLPGGRTGFASLGGGAAVIGQYGAAMEPFIEDRLVRTCLPGMVLGKDGFCYNRRDISNKEREYPKGTRPLGTPGEMAALRKAASFGRRMESTVKRMQKIGVLKKPSPRGRRPSAPAQRQIGPGPSIINVE